MRPPHFASSSALHLKGADAPNVWTTWHDDGTLSVLFDGAPNQYFGFAGTPQEVRLALAKGLAAIDRAVKERETAKRAELAVADALEEPAMDSRNAV